MTGPDLPIITAECADGDHRACDYLEPGDCVCPCHMPTMNP